MDQHQINMSKQQFILALIIFGVVAFIIVALFYVEIPGKNESTLNLVLGAILGIAGTVATFSFPGTINSAARDQTISNLATAAAAPSKQTTTTTVETIKQPEGGQGHDVSDTTTTTT